MKAIFPKLLGVFLCLNFVNLQTVYAQTTLQGLVLNDAEQPMSFANVLLINPADSSLILGNITADNGSYTFENVAAGNYQINVTSIGYKDYYSDEFSLDDKPSWSIPTAILSEDIEVLEGVEVVEKKAIFEQQIDRLVVNVDNTIALTGTTALEVLKRSPGVAVNPQNNTISMSGKNGVVVMINGKISRMPADAVVQMLSGMSSDNIQKIELIHTPPSNFDAEGNAGFINIVLKKSQDDGMNGGFSLNTGYGKKEKAGVSINLNFRKRKVNVFGDYSWKYNNNPQVFRSYRGFDKDGVFFETSGESIREPTRTHVQNARIGVDYNVGENTIIGGLISWTDRYWNMEAVNDVRNLENNIVTSRLRIPNDEINHASTYVGNINLQHQFVNDQKINIDLDYATFFNDNPSTYTNQYFDGDNQLLNEDDIRVSKETPLDIWVGKIDYTKKFGEKLIFEAGLKGAISSFDNTVKVEERKENDWVVAPLFSSDATMNETVGAAYTAFNWKLTDKTDAKIGLRYEYADINISTVETPDLVDRQNGRLFPSVFLAHQLNDKNKVQFSYSRRIDRPSFRQLAPFFIFFDPSTVITGNPTLQASISDAFRGTYSWNVFQLNIDYTYTQNPIGRFQPTVNLEDNTLVDQSKNFVDGHLASIGFSIPITITEWWELRTNWTGRWSKVNDIINNQSISFENTNWFVNGSSTIRLPKKYSLEISGRYFSASRFGAVIWQSFNTVDVGIQKEFENKMGTLKFAISDLLLGGNWNGILDNEDINFQYRGYFGLSERVFRLTYSQRFGNSKLKGQRKRATGSAEEQGRVR